ncbi:hypothetical protein [Thermus thermophilus]|uniref:hypothetical protein n=1 Tax=Thermus thermophilus TaxID=274 RepID=UPI001FCB1076|nr:hypothetical protein [Thermus thermophilus]
MLFLVRTEDVPGGGPPVPNGFSVSELKPRTGGEDRKALGANAVDDGVRVDPERPTFGPRSGRYGEVSPELAAKAAGEGREAVGDLRRHAGQPAGGFVSSLGRQKGGKDRPRHGGDGLGLGEALAPNPAIRPGLKSAAFAGAAPP